jgi:hypothetical protein
MQRTVTYETSIDDPALIEKVAIAIFEKTQGSWEYAREADREWLRLEARAAIATFLKHIEERDGISRARDGRQPGEYAVETPAERQLQRVGNNPFLIGQSILA